MKCGNGVLQGDEECECASGTECKFCSNCKLEDGKECTPDSAAACCDDEGAFLTTTASCQMPHGARDGYCNRGVCASLTRTCVIEGVEGTSWEFDRFCGASGENTCKAQCGSSDCSDSLYDTSRWGNLAIHLKDGAICQQGTRRGECTAGICAVGVACGDGVLQGAEECECGESGTTECR